MSSFDSYIKEKALIKFSKMKSKSLIDWADCIIMTYMYNTYYDTLHKLYDLFDIDFEVNAWSFSELERAILKVYQMPLGRVLDNE